MTNQQTMKKYLNQAVIAPLREKGFTGTYPHFRRSCKGCVELISFLTNKWGGSFTVELSAVFPGAVDTNYVAKDPIDEKTVTVWDTNRRYRLKGMVDGWFHYRDLYMKRNLFYGKIHLEAPVSPTADFTVPKGYKPAQIFSDQTAAEICEEVNKQLLNGFQWLEKLERKYAVDVHQV